MRLCIYKCYLACTVIFGSVSGIFRRIRELFKSILTHIHQADTDVFKTSSGRLKKVMTSYDQTRRRHDIWKMTSDL